MTTPEQFAGTFDFGIGEVRRLAETVRARDRAMALALLDELIAGPLALPAVLQDLRRRVEAGEWP